MSKLASAGPFCRRISGHRAAKILKVTENGILKLAVAGRLTAVVELGQPFRYDRDQVMRLAAELGTLQDNPAVAAGEAQAVAS
jgi:hypothetical protein